MTESKEIQINILSKCDNCDNLISDEEEVLWGLFRLCPECDSKFLETAHRLLEEEP